MCIKRSGKRCLGLGACKEIPTCLLFNNKLAILPITRFKTSLSIRSSDSSVSLAHCVLHSKALLT